MPPEAPKLNNPKILREAASGCAGVGLGCLALLIAPLLLYMGLMLLLEWDQGRRSSPYLLRLLPPAQRQAVDVLKSAGHEVHASLNYRSDERPTRLTVVIHNTGTDATRTALTQLPNIEHLSLKGIADAGDWLSNLPEMTSMLTLRLPGSGLNSADLQSLERFPALEELDLSRTRIDSASLAHLKFVPNLRTLMLDHTQISGGMEVIAKLKRLQSLSLTGSDLSDDDVPHICLPTMEPLIINDTKISSKGFAPMPQLGRFVADQTLIDDAIFPILAASPRLQRLSLTGTRIKGIDIGKLPMSYLDYVKLDETDVGDDVCKTLSHYPALEFLSLLRTEVTSTGLQSLVACPQLRQLNISPSATKPDAGVLPLFAAKKPFPCRVWVDERPGNQHGFKNGDVKK